MESSKEVFDFTQKIEQHISTGSFIKLTLSKHIGPEKTLQNIYARLVNIKSKTKISFTFRHQTKDIVKNHSVDEAIAMIGLWLGNDFLNGDLFSLEEDVSILFNKKRKARLVFKKPIQTKVVSKSHDKNKKRYLSESANYLHQMGIANAKGRIVKSGQRKFKQINKYIEIIDSLIKESNLPNDPHIVDMGSGKGYLTFGLYDYLKNSLDLNPNITGIELRTNLVQFCNDLAKENKFDQLQFLAKDINDFQPNRIDMLIALHACDIATDIAIAKGIQANAEIIVVAPCCHKQVRREMDCQTEMRTILKHGILEERQAELITDGIRALLLEANGYKTKVFEFISTEHTSKNLMIVGIKSKANKNALAEVAKIKKQFGIKTHYLETLLNA